MTKILFGQSYYLRFDPKLWDAMQPYPPLGTMYAASWLREHGYDVALFDAMLADSTEEWRDKLVEHQPDFAVIYEDNFNYLSKMCLLNMREAAFEMIGMAKAANSIVILCGSDATDHAEDYIAAGADFVLLGEGEETLLALLEQATKADFPDYAGVLGLVYRDETAVFARTPPRPVMKQIDNLPFPAWDLIDVERYRNIWLEHSGYYSMNMSTTRGCPYHCNWCAKPIWGQRYSSRSPESVAEEMRWLKEKYHPDHIWFVDDIMGLKPGWWQAFADAVERLDTRTPFKCLSRADLIVREADNVHALARAGCEIVWMGAESGSQKILNAMDKGITVAQIYEASARLHEAGIKVAFFLQFGYPGETRADIEMTLQMVRDCEPDDVGMSVSYPLPGTPFYENVKRQLGKQQNWTDSADLAMMYQGTFVTEFYRQLHIVLHKEFRSRKAWAAAKRAVQGQEEINGRLVRDLLASIVRIGTLPYARWKLERLTAVSPHQLDTLPHMSLQEAAKPTPQEPL
jgi:anaerobic magnesium-protoporphyrin IX monomethyl ester cyclase